MTAEADVTVVDWDSFNLEEFTRELRGNLSGPDADKLIWAFEHAVEVVRTDDDLLSYLVVAILCLLARLDESSPRTVLEAFFRRSVSDEAWRGRASIWCQTQAVSRLADRGDWHEERALTSPVSDLVGDAVVREHEVRPDST
jgi:hypothetical protein